MYNGRQNSNSKLKINQLRTIVKSHQLLLYVNCSSCCISECYLEPVTGLLLLNSSLKDKTKFTLIVHAKDEKRVSFTLLSNISANRSSAVFYFIKPFTCCYIWVKMETRMYHQAKQAWWSETLMKASWLKRLITRILFQFHPTNIYPKERTI
jgi:hypothetical protein